jgi:hypothetical protein
MDDHLSNRASTTRVTNHSAKGPGALMNKQIVSRQRSKRVLIAAAAQGKGCPRQSKRQQRETTVIATDPTSPHGWTPRKGRRS